MLDGWAMRVTALLGWALVFFVLAVIAAVLGFGGIAAGATSIAKILFVVFLIAGAVVLLFELVGRSRLPRP
jgi:uncharacterized membrane protein YtjA (UPF0391 family)